MVCITGVQKLNKLSSMVISNVTPLERVAPDERSIMKRVTFPKFYYVLSFTFFDLFFVGCPGTERGTTIVNSTPNPVLYNLDSDGLLN